LLAGDVALAGADRLQASSYEEQKTKLTFLLIFCGSLLAGDAALAGADRLRASSYKA
jgi:hypothetical protein